MSSEDILPDENKLKLKSMNKPRNNNSRRFSIVKFELPSFNSNSTKGLHKYIYLNLINPFIYKDEHKSTIPSSSPNLIQKLLFRQFNPKTRPYSMGISVMNFFKLFILIVYLFISRLMIAYLQQQY